MENLPAYDCHCHILPGLDDGAQTLEEALFLAGKLASYGFRRAVCTSHRTRLYPNTPETVVPACERLQEAIDRAGIRLQLIPSMEYRLIPETWPEARAKGWLLPWEGNHILVELPISNPLKIGDIDPAAEIRSLVADGYQPVLAHPERYLWATLDDYRRWRSAGAAFQRNLASLEGFYGPGPAARARQLLDAGFYTFAGTTYLGTDTHNRRYTDAFDAVLGRAGC
jgi:tyrosine-protein phosphatase YwqE